MSITTKKEVSRRGSSRIDFDQLLGEVRVGGLQAPKYDACDQRYAHVDQRRAPRFFEHRAPPSSPEDAANRLELLDHRVRYLRAKASNQRAMGCRGCSYARRKAMDVPLCPGM